MPAPRRFLSLWLPRLGSDLALRRIPLDAPFALVAMQAGAERLCCLNARAEALGLARGMGLADARALCPDLMTRPEDNMAHMQGLQALQRWAARYCPWVARDAMDGLMLDITGSSHLWGGESALLADLKDRLAHMGLTMRAAIAGTRGAAWAVARYRRDGGLVPPGQEGRALGPLPLAALRLDADSVAALDRLGLHIIRDLAQIPRSTLPRRFGPDLLLRLDQALGRVAEPLSPDPVRRHYGVRLSLPEPIGLKADVQAGLARLLDRICQHLHDAEMGARRLVLDVSRVDRQALRLEIGLARPMRDAQAMESLFDHALEGLDAGYGIDALRLTAPVVESLPLQQISTTGAQEQDDLADLLTRLSNRVGFAHVQRFLPADSHIPEKGFSIAAAAYSAPSSGWPSACARPIILFPPEPIIGTGRRVPSSFRWRGRWWHVRAASGPERISPEWWLDDPAWRSGLRDYWQVQTEQGPRLWLFHTPQRDGWCIQGEFA